MLVHDSLVRLTVVEGTMHLVAGALGARSTLSCFVDQWVVLELLPAMALATSVFQLAAVLVGFGRFLGFPVGALDLRVVVDVWRPAKVLPIVSEDTLVSLVILFGHWAPDRLEVEHVKVRIPLHLVEQRHGQLGLTVREGTHIPILARVDLVGVVCTKLGLVFLGVIEFLNAVVTLGTLFLVVARHVALGDRGAQLTVVGGGRPSMVSGFRVVVEYALFRVVSRRELAGERFEGHQVEEEDLIGLAVPVTLFFRAGAAGTGFLTAGFRKNLNRVQRKRTPRTGLQTDHFTQMALRFLSTLKFGRHAETRLIQALPQGAVHRGERGEEGHLKTSVVVLGRGWRLLFILLPVLLLLSFLAFAFPGWLPTPGSSSIVLTLL